MHFYPIYSYKNFLGITNDYKIHIIKDKTVTKTKYVALNLSKTLQDYFPVSNFMDSKRIILGLHMKQKYSSLC